MYMPSGGNARFIEAAEKFDAAHGGDPVFIGTAGVGGYYLFGDGATRPYDSNCLAPGVDPPVDDNERILLILKWHELHVKEATAKFNKLRDQLDVQAHNAEEFAGRGGPEPPSEQQIRELKELHIRARVKIELLSKAREEYGHREDPGVEARRIYRDNIREEAQRQRAKIQAIEL